MREHVSIILPDPPKTKIQLMNIPSYEIQDWDLHDPKQLTKYFFTIEKIVRSSYSYHKMIEFLRTHVDMNHCSFFKNVNNIDTFSIKIHIHHEPFTLFDIVNTVYAKRLARQETLSENQVAKEVMWLHYRMTVGLIPLSETVHELVHNGFLFIPTTKVFGYYKKFLVDYEPYIDSEVKRILAKNEEFSMKYDFAEETKILNVHTVYIDPSGSYELPLMQDIAEILQRKIDDIDKANTAKLIA
jgi:hypothetical protein